ncbi:GumC family protein [Thalassotalea sp. ND16A]|uniref:GumC family protein n=1 Tax=Thalassotalea sp. ND16A TaxID=1535422 RepID=UPI00051A1868|nr:polysaccharide biosynthesis tyrosine autokinase [Thalassotalea sp. ND16A]KGJ94206.1 Non-specific protein-tyrosine kinase [Thalassotalea sp. ND16A]
MSNIETIPTRLQPNYQETSNGRGEHVDEIDLAQLLRVILRRKWQIILLSTVVALFASVYAYSITPIYTASATFYLEADNAKLMSLEDVYSQEVGQQEYYYTQLEIIRSQPIAEKVVKNLDLANHPFFRITKQELLTTTPEYLSLTDDELTALTQQYQYESALGYVYGGIDANPIKDTQLVILSFTSPEPELAAIIANAIGIAYIDNHMEVNLERIEKSAQWLNRSLSGLKNKLGQSEEKLQAFQEQESIIDVVGIKSLAAIELEELSAELVLAKQSFQQTDTIYRLVNAEQNNIEGLASLPDILNHQAVTAANSQKRQAEEQVAELALTYGKKHPKMIAANADLRREQQNVTKNIERLVSSLGNDYRKAENKVDQVNNAINQAKLNYQKLTRIENKRRELKQEVETNKNLYEAFFIKLNETAQLEGLEVSAGRIIEYATTPVSPIKPRKKLIVVLAVLLSGMVGVGATLLLEALNSTIRAVVDVETKLHKNLLGIVPLVATGKLGKLNIKHFFDGDDHSFAEAIRTLRTSLLLLNLEDKAQVVSVTSTLPGEGKTVVSTNLAFALGQLDKTILIDTDMRRPSIAKNFNLAGNTPGLSNYIAGTNSLDECIQHDQQANIDVLVAGQLPPNPQELLSSNQFKQLLHTLREKYDRIIIDTAPVQAVSDAMIVARLTDSHIYVVKADSTKEKQIKTGIKRMALAGINVDGIVLNQVDLEKAKKYEDFNGYYDQYGYNS